MKKILFFGLLSLSVISCKNTNQDKTAVVEETLTTEVSNLEKGLKGSFSGVIPCASCEGISLKLELKASNTYELTMEYLGEEGSKPEILTGNFSQKGEIITLEGIKDMSNLFKVTEKGLLYLDAEGNQIEGPLADKYLLSGNFQ